MHKSNKVIVSLNETIKIKELEDNNDFRKNRLEVYNTQNINVV